MPLLRGNFCIVHSYMDQIFFQTFMHQIFFQTVTVERKSQATHLATSMSLTLSTLFLSAITTQGYMRRRFIPPCMPKNSKKAVGLDVTAYCINPHNAYLILRRALLTAGAIEV